MSTGPSRIIKWYTFWGSGTGVVAVLESPSSTTYHQEVGRIKMVGIPLPLTNQWSRVWVLLSNFLVGSALPILHESWLVGLVGFEYWMCRTKKCSWTNEKGTETVSCFILFIFQNKHTGKETYSFTYPKKWDIFVFVVFIYVSSLLVYSFRHLSLLVRFSTY